MQSKFKRWIVAALPLAMACTVNAQGNVTEVSTRTIDGGLAVHISGTDLARPTSKWDDGAVIFTFDANLTAKAKTWKPNSGGIKAISFAKIGKQVKVAVRPAKTKQPQMAKVEDGWLVYFEDNLDATVPALTPTTPTKAQTTPQKTAYTQKPNFAPVNPRDFKPKALVTLNFVNTDIVQILKALAMQANVNVAMGPDVTGKVTINLENVPVDDAMDMVTTLGGVRFAYVNNTYVVSSAARYADTMESISHRSGLTSETRVVPLFSREGNQVKAAILKMVPPSTADGKYELVLPSEKLSVQQTQDLTPSDDKSGEKAGAGSTTQTDTKVQQVSTQDSNKKDDYVVLVGTPGRMDSVEKAVRSLDEQICLALGIKMGSSQAQVSRTYSPKGILAQDLVKALVGDGKKEFNNVQILATPATSVSRQSIVMTGREADVDRVLAMVADLDTTPDQGETQYEVVGLKFIKPNFAQVQLLQAVPGIKASFLPPPVDPRVGIDYSEQGTQSNSGGAGSGEGNQGASSGSGSSGPAAGSQSTGQATTGAGPAPSSNGQLGTGGQANTTIRTSTVTNSIPMKLLLRGTPEQLEAAKRYLAVVDIAPKQVAVELRVMELSRDDALKVGLDWSVLTGGTLQTLHINQGLGDDSFAGGVKTGLRFAGGGTATVLGMLDQISTKNNVLARPSILANDGVPTNIFVGDEVRYVKSITNSNNGGLQVVTDEVDVGVDFNVTARIGDDGNIMLDLGPTLKVLQGFTSVPGGGNLPQTSRRSAATQMTIHSGETIAIGGLIQDQDRKVYGGIPILRDLPLIGRLFGRTNNEKIRSEVVFFVTVREVSEADRQGAANPRQAERDNKDWPGNKDGKKGG